MSKLLILFKKTLCIEYYILLVHTIQYVGWIDLYIILITGLGLLSSKVFYSLRICFDSNNLQPLSSCISLRPRQR